MTSLSTDEFIEKIKQDYADKSAFIGICGLSGSGKTTLANKLSTIFPERSLVIHLDDFCVASTAERKFFLQDALDSHDMDALTSLAEATDPSENPYANPLSWYNWPGIARCFDKLKEGKTVARQNSWNQETGDCDLFQVYMPPEVEPPLYFIDCIYLNEPELTDHLDIVAMIDVSDEVAHSREAERDKHRNDAAYLDYKKIIQNLHCIPYLENHKKDVDFIIKD